MQGPVAFILKGYPRLSETFIAQEIRSLEGRGLDIRIVSLRHPTDTAVHPVHDEIRAPVNYLPEYLYQEPLRMLRAWRAVRRLATYRRTRAAWLKDLWRDRTPNRVRRFGQALVLAHELPAEITRLHAHFLHTPASVARYAAMLRELPWSVSAHAKDIWTTPDWEKREKLAECDWLVTCSAAAKTHLSALLSPQREPETVGLVYHGIDLHRFSAIERLPSRNDGHDGANPVRLLSVGRAVAKKGYDDLIAALAQLPGNMHWHLDHIGGGPRLQRLQAAARTAGIEDRITWHGPQAHDKVLAAYRRADLFVLASRIAGDGDRDGLPNVLMEAQSQGLACIATAISAIPELIRDQETGLLVPERDPAALAAALAALIANPDRRNRLGRAGQQRIRAAFSHDLCLDDLAARFDLAAESAMRHAGA